MVKSKELKKIDNWKEEEEESGNSGWADGEDCKDRNHM
jgi:hypothetical protein